MSSGQKRNVVSKCFYKRVKYHFGRVVFNLDWYNKVVFRRRLVGDKLNAQRNHLRRTNLWIETCGYFHLDLRLILAPKLKLELEDMIFRRCGALSLKRDALAIQIRFVTG